MHYTLVEHYYRGLSFSIQEMLVCSLFSFSSVVCRLSFIATYFVSWSQAMHCTDLMRTQSLIEEVDGGHLAPENSLFVHIWSATNVTLIKGLEKRETCHFFITFLVASKDDKIFTNFVFTWWRIPFILSQKMNLPQCENCSLQLWLKKHSSFSLCSKGNSILPSAFHCSCQVPKGIKTPERTKKKSFLHQNVRKIVS